MTPTIIIDNGIVTPPTKSIVETITSGISILKINSIMPIYTAIKKAHVLLTLFVFLTVAS